MRKQKGQAILEYTVIVIVILGVMVAMRDYVKRGIQGRLKSASDDLGGQYDPTAIQSNVLYSLQTNSETIVAVVNGTDNSTGTVVQGQWTNRQDLANSLETKTGFTQVGN
jgi:Flp pilus assembly pilin Flp